MNAKLTELTDHLITIPASGNAAARPALQTA
jgi:hypothetical protein